MKNIKPQVSLLMLFVLCGVHSWAQSRSCSSLLKRDENSRRTFLVSQQSKKQSPCITRVIDSLRTASDPETIMVLLHYLDYMDPATARIPGIGYSRRPDFPAVNTLFAIGKPAVPGLLSTIENSSTPLAERNASLTFSYIYRDDLAAGIRRLKQEQAIATPVGRSRLAAVIQMLADFCGRRTRDEALNCKKELREGRP
jgi:hypothetical protein